MVLRKQKELFGLKTNNILEKFSSGVLLSMPDHESLNCNSINQLRKDFRSEGILKAGKKGVFKKAITNNFADLYRKDHTGFLILAAFNDLKFKALKNVLLKYKKSLSFVSAMFDNNIINIEKYEFLATFQSEIQLFSTILTTLISSAYILFHIINHYFITLEERESAMIASQTRKNTMETIEEDISSGKCQKDIGILLKQVLQLSINDAMGLMEYMKDLGMQPSVSAGAVATAAEAAPQQKQEYQLKIVEITAATKVPVVQYIKKIKGLENLSMMEAMGLVAIDKTFNDIVFTNKADAQNIVNDLAALGVKCEITV